MREAWVPYGDVLFLDSMKRQMNKLHWPYIGPCVLDDELRVQPVCECLIKSESLDSYAFVLNALFEMETNRQKQTVWIIFADGFLTNALLPLVGVSVETTRIIWNHFYLNNDVWPTHFGLYFYDKVKTEMRRMLQAMSRTDFDAAFQEVANFLRDNPAKLEYVKI
jgi:hypothetical protein